MLIRRSTYNDLKADSETLAKILKRLFGLKMVIKDSLDTIESLAKLPQRGKEY
jgi:hypothetical protein